MEEELTLMQAALEAQGYNYRFHWEAMRAENLEILQSHCKDWPLQRFFQVYSFDEAVELGLVWYSQANCFKKEFEWDEYFAACIRVALLPIGSGLNGDPIVIDIRDAQMGFLYHDKLLEQDETDPRACLVKLNCSIGQFFYNAVTQAEYPVDAYSAVEYMSSQN